MNNLMFIDAKNFHDFLERFLINAISPPILLLLLIFIFKYKKMSFNHLKPFTFIVILYVFFDLSLRLYYTFILNMENQTRYFLIQSIFYLIPAGLACEYLVNKNSQNKKKFTIILCAILVIFGSVRSLKPKWDKLEYKLFAKIIKDDPAKYKYVFEVKKDSNGSPVFEEDYRTLYYSGIYVDKSIRGKSLTIGSCYFITKERFETISVYKVKLIASSKNKLFLYKVLSD